MSATASMVRPEVAALLAPLFRYPDADHPSHAAAVLAALDREAAKTRLAAFVEEVRPIPLPDLQALYTSTFDLAPVCSPYLGVQLFGEDTRDRARLLVGLRTSGVKGDELPDHIGEVLGHAAEFVIEEWDDLVELVIAPAVRKMEALLSGSMNPYRHVIAAMVMLCARGEA